ncbi:MAG: CoA ester lyase [Acidobacteria bacterium]|nr:CoA ester lyase [Acidobacteriota bacterium]
MIGHSRRSVLYVPGDSEKMLRRSATMPADLLLLNLEDGVAASQKDLARDTVVRALQQVDFGAREVVVRVNGLDTETGKSDLAAVVSRRIDGICLPKIEKKEEIQAADSAILTVESRAAIPRGTVRLHAMIESAAGVLHAAEIAAASPRMASLIFGSADYANDIRCRPGPDRREFLLAMQMMVVASRAAGIDAIDAPCFDLKNPDALRRESDSARRLGFEGKSALHPDQLPVINQTFDVTEAEVAWAEDVLAELDEAEKRGKALSTLDGNLIDNPHRAAAKRILQRKDSRLKIED